MNIVLLLSVDEGFYAIRPHRSIKIIRHCLAAILVSVAAKVVYAPNPRVSALFQYFSELPWNWMLVLKFLKRAIFRDLFVDSFHEGGNLPPYNWSDLFPNADVVD
jgi:hypothetical protein